MGAPCPVGRLGESEAIGELCRFDSVFAEYEPGVYTDSYSVLSKYAELPKSGLE